MLAWQRRSLQRLLPLASSCAMLDQSRGMSMRLFELFSKEKREERKKKLREEMERGYFDDFKEIRQNKGKIFYGGDRLIPAAQARRFPPIDVSLPDGSDARFPPGAAAVGAAEGAAAAAAAEGAVAGGVEGAAAASATAAAEGAAAGGGSSSEVPGSTLVAVAFRAGAQEMLEAWTVPFAQQFEGRPGISVTELSLVEQAVMKVWPFKQAILRGGGQQGGRVAYALPSHFLFYFGGTDELREALLMTNRLTGYVYLVDWRGRVRWRGSGSPEPAELQQLLRCTEDLLAQQAKQAESDDSSNSSSQAGK